MNIVTIKSEYIPAEIAAHFDLVPQKHNDQNQWYKVVLMEHVEVDHLNQLLEELKENTVTIIS